MTCRNCPGQHIRRCRLSALCWCAGWTHTSTGLHFCGGTDAVAAPYLGWIEDGPGPEWYSEVRAEWGAA